ncbi:Uncharacterised protein [Mycobacteroides abscessus]|nr:Uncharacterised protein [Mycobacteroides abscessus]
MTTKTSMIITGSAKAVTSPSTLRSWRRVSRPTIVRTSRAAVAGVCRTRGRVVRDGRGRVVVGAALIGRPPSGSGRGTRRRGWAARR